MEDSILKSVKDILSVPADDTAFDLNVLIQINSAFASMHQIGVGPTSPFEIEDDTATWSSFLPGPEYNSVKTYIALKVRSYFDPPQNGFAVTAMEKQLLELEHRLNTVREMTDWVSPIEEEEEEEE